MKIKLDKVNPIDNGRIEIVISKLNIIVPKEFITFFSEYNGAVGKIGNSYIMVYNIDDVLHFNVEAQKYIPDIFLFATNGGGEEYGINHRNGEYVRVPSIFCDYDDVEHISDSLSGFIDYLENQYNE